MKYFLTLILFALALPVFAQQRALQKSSTQRKPGARFTEHMPKFDGNMVDYFFENLKYPPEAQKNSIEGRAVVEFIVRKNGRVSDVKVVSSAGHGFDEAAVEAVKSMPRWAPGRQLGKAVDVCFTLPVAFKL